MKRRCLLLLFCIHNVVIGLAQNSDKYITIQFAKNKYNIPAEHRVLLINLAETLALRSGYKIFINGHADSDADSSYNKELSLKRGLSVKSLLIEEGIDSNLITTRALGEDQPLVANATPIGKAKNRRVEVIVLFEQEFAEQVSKFDTLARSPEVCESDTLVELNDGFRIELSKCDWEKNKNCLRVIKNFRYNYKIKENWLKKHIGFKNYRKHIAIEPHYDFIITSCGQSCFKKAVKLFIPQYQAKELDIKRKYAQKRNDHGRSVNRVYKKDKIGDSAFYSTDVYCPFDCGTDNRCQHLVKLKSRKDIDMISYSYFERSSTSYFDSLIEVKPGNPNLLIDRYPHTWFNTLKLLYKTDTIVLKQIPIDIFPNNHKKIKTRGSKYDRKYIMFIPFRRVYKCGHYKLYKIRPRDIEKLKNFNLTYLIE